MAPRVPYSPVPDVAPADVSTPSIHVNAPLEAFGGAAAAGLSHLGSALEGAGNEVYARAYAMQDLNNRAEAQELFAKYADQSGDRHIQFTSLQGKQAQDAYDPYKKDIIDLRSRIGAEASAPMVQKLYNSESLGLMSRTVFAGATHAGAETKRYQISANASAHKAIMDQVQSFPDDPAAFNDGITKARELAVHSSGLMGNQVGDEATKLAVKQAESDVWTSKIMGMMRKDPDSAKKLMEAALDQGRITGQDYQKLQNPVDTVLHSVVSRNVSDAVQRGWAPYVTPEQQTRSEGVEQSLVDTIKKAQQNHPELQFGIGYQGGRRVQGEQDKLFAQGRTAPGTIVTWTRQSEHLTGRAADVVPYNKTTDAGAVVAAMREAADQLGVKLADLPQLASKDPNHFQLAKDYNVGEYKPGDPPTLEQRQSAAEKFVEDKYGDPKMTYTTRDRVRTDWNLEQTNQKNQNHQDYLTLANFAYDNKITSRDVILNQPNLFATYNRLDEPMKKRVDGLIAANAKEPTLDTPEKSLATQKLLNMSTELSGKRDMFLKLDPADLMDKGIVSTKGMGQLYAKQRQIMEKQATDSAHLSHAMSVANELFKSYGVTKDLQTDKGDDYYTQATGQMDQWLRYYEQKHHAPPGDTEIHEHAREMISTSGGWLGSSIGASFGFEQPSPDFVKEISDIYRAQKGSDGPPSAKEISNMYKYSLSHPNWRSEISK